MHIRIYFHKQLKLFKQISSRSIKDSSNHYNFITGNSMKRNQRASFEFNLKEHEFVFTLEAIRSARTMEGIFTLQLQKGCRHLTSLNEPIEFDKKGTFIFNQRKPISMRAYKQRSMNFSWSLYKADDGMLSFVDSFNINLQNGYLSYLQEIRNFPFDYSRVCQQRAEGQEIGQSWKLLKLHLKGHQIHQTIKNATGDLTLECTINIRNEPDRITEAEALKSIKKIQPELQEKSTSSRNSLKEKKKVRIIDEEKAIEKETELKIDSTIKCEPENGTSHGEQIIAEHQDEAHNGKGKSLPYLPIGQNLLKSKTILSDIIQASYEGESHVNNGDKSDRRPSQSNLQIPVQAKKFTKTKTYHFQNSENTEPKALKRNNSFQLRKNHQIEHEEEHEYELIRVSEASEASKDQLTKESTIIRADLSQPKIQLQIESNIKRYIILIFVIYVLLGGLLCSQMKDQLDLVVAFPKKSERIRKDNLRLISMWQNSAK